MRVVRFLCLALFAIVIIPAGRAGEEKVAIDKLPRPVVEAVKKRFPKAELKAASKETEDGKTEYEVAIVDGSTKIDVQLSPDGTITTIEKEVDFASLPDAVRGALEKAYGKATYKKAEEIIKVQAGKESLDCYEVVVEKADKKKVEVQLESDGKLRKEEKQ
jgi:hypothetical protein